ncbi:MAG: MotA/TolQ/ExbB proton channel family protein [Solirubrobacterales bacterium]
MTSLILATSVGDQITQAVADVAEALRYPVLIAALIALVVVAYELGRLAVEAWKRAQRPKTPFEQTARQAVAQKQAGDTAGAQATLKSYSYGEALQTAAVGTLFAPNPIDAQRAVIEYDLYVSKRLDRVRLLVRAGPALGLMGTLIPLAPALAALGKGQPSVLADELQTAFAITVVGVLVGLVAFTVALIRERYFTRDLADLEFLRELRGDAAVLVPASAPQPSAAAPIHLTSTDQPAAPATDVSADTVVAPAPAPATPAAKPAEAPAAPISAASTGSTPVTPAGNPAAPQAPAAAANPPAFPPPVSAEPKKKFGLRKKTPKTPEAPPSIFPPPPPAATIPSADELTDVAKPPAAEGKPEKDDKKDE